MNRPSPIYWLLGAPIVTIGILGGCGYWLYWWWHHTSTTDNIPIIVSAVLIYNALKANAAVRRYKDWQKLREEITGIPTVSKAQRVVQIVGFIGVVIFIFWQALPEDKRSQFLSFVVLGIAAIYAAYRFFRMLWRAARRPWASKAKPEFIAEMCLPVPRQALSAAKSLKVVPEYCLRLLKP